MPARSTKAPKREKESPAGRREQRRLQQLDLGRTQILDAAEEVFGAKGFHDTTLREVAELAEYSVGSVYSFFDNKDDLFLQVFIRRGDEMLPGLQAIADRDADPLDKLRAIVDHEVGFFRTHPHFGRVYIHAASTPTLGPERPLPTELSDNFDVAMRCHARVFQEGQRAGVLRAGDPEVLARLLSGLIYSYQSLDPAIVGDHDTSERLPLHDLRAIIEGAFGRA
jgi:TetR/AcrR family transcriptional regulator